MSNISGSQRFEQDHVRRRNSAMKTNPFFSYQPEQIIKPSRIVKRYIELLYHLQTFYEKLSDQLYGGNVYLRNNAASQQSVFIHHCRKIAEQLQRSKPIWDRKVI
jgi:hypothetical protein